MNFIRTSLLGLLALPLAAQSTGLSVGASLIYAPKQYFGSYDKVMHTEVGAILNAGYDMNIYQTDVPARATLTYAYMPGKADHGLKTSLHLLQLAGDLFIQMPDPALRGVVGLSLNSYRMQNSSNNSFPSGNANHDENWVTSDYEHHYPVQNTKGIKFGYRLGLEYAFTKSISAEILMQQTELSGHSSSDTFTRRGGINPAWLQFGAHYRF